MACHQKTQGFNLLTTNELKPCVLKKNYIAGEFLPEILVHFYPFKSFILSVFLSIWSISAAFVLLFPTAASTLSI